MKKPAGFTLLEVVIAIGLLAVIGVLLLGNFGSWMNFYQSMENDQRLKQLLAGMNTAYDQNAFSINNTTDAVIRLDDTPTDILPTAVDESGHCQVDETTLAPLATYAGLSAKWDLWHDGYENPLCVFISPALSLQPALLVAAGQSDNGQSSPAVTVWYHVIAFVSPGPNGHLDTRTGMDDQGNLTLDGDDRGYVFSGYALSQGKVDQSVQRLTRLAKAYEVYFKTRYAAAQQVTVDYFANKGQGASSASLWDSAGSIDNSGGDVKPVDQAMASGQTLLQVMGLSPSDGTDGYGAVISMDNSSGQVRSPDNTNAAMKTAPFTARFVTTLPGPSGNQLSISALGTY